jgi:hypothetical protein
MALSMAWNPMCRPSGSTNTPSDSHIVDMAMSRFSALRSPNVSRFFFKRSSTLCIAFSLAYPWLYLSQAPIDEQLDARYVAAVVGCQEQNGLRDFIGGARTAQRNIANRTLYKLIDLFLCHT